MGRFYNAQADTPQFVEGMYTPPWELINSKLEENQKGYENTLATTNLFNDIDIQHIEDPVVKEQAQQIKDYYTGKATAITDAIKNDPTAWRKAMPNIQNLSRELQKDMKSGDIYNMQQSYASMAKFAEDNKDLRTSDPGLYNQAMNYYYSKWKEDPLRKKVFEWNPIVKRIDQDKMNKEIQAMKADMTEQSNGLYLVGNKYVSKDRVDDAVRSFVYSRPENMAFLQQQVMFKDPEYYNAGYEATHPGSGGLYETLYKAPDTVDEQGNTVEGRVLTDDEILERQKKYQEDMNNYLAKVKKKDKNAVPPKADWIQKDGALGQMMKGSEALGAYSQQTLKADAVGVAKMNIASREAIAKANLLWQVQKEEGANKLKGIGIAQRQLEAVNDIIADMNKNTPNSQKNTPEYKAKMEDLEKQRTELLTTTGAMIFGTKKEEPKENSDVTVEGNTTTTKGNETKTSAPVFSLYTPPKKADDKTLITPISLDIPDNLAALKAAPKDSRDHKLYIQGMQTLRDQVAKAVSGNPALKKYSDRFLKFYDEAVGTDKYHGDITSEGINDMIEEFLIQDFKTHGAPAILGKKGKTYPASTYLPEELVKGRKNLSVTSLYRGSYGAPSETDAVFDAYAFAVGQLKNQMIDAIGKPLGKIEEGLKLPDEIKHYSVVPVTEQGSNNLIAQIRLSPSAFTIREVKNDGTFGKSVPNTLTQGDNMKIGNAIIGAVGNDHKNALYMYDDRTKSKYVVYPNENNGDASKSIENILNEKSFTSAQGGNLRYWNRDSNAVLRDIKETFDVTPATKAYNLDGTEKAGYNYNITKPIYNNKGTKVDFIITQQNVNGRTYYGATPIGETLPIVQNATSIESLYNLIQSKIKE